MSNFKHRIVIFVCYYGTFPWYFKYFLHSCKFNPSVDFIIFTDIPCKEELPDNVSVEIKSLNDIRTLVSEKLGYAVNIDTPYKLCDYKPVLGLIFNHYASGYDFWGQCDIDIILGDLRSFMDEGFLNAYDFVSCRDTWATGFFSVFRNNEKMNTLFKRGKDSRKVFSDPKYWGFDEFNFKHFLIDQEHSVWDVETEIETFTLIVRNAQKSGEIQAHFDFICLEGLPGKVKFVNGKLIYHNRFEAILYHLYALKRIYSPVVRKRRIPETFHISQTRIYNG